ncbi:Uma2 family endonuclease [Leptolyngbya iicbica]|uniref:Uma2 family endonuclease n=2 Tax=Cyanophyceae TaxID=3028117 RepID=A0A4Q7EFW6_9CYAN|nr:Uma2 family endonuclease [Leptolyngbya sp. LK]RZM82153.1 Uma2 family endonuclease [Leptolyngbya sp. LK]
MTLSTSPTQTDTWVKATWDDFAALMDDPQYEEGRGYFDHGYMRIEMASLGRGHARQNTLISQLISIYGMLRNLRIIGLMNGSIYKPGERGCQPDMAFYIGDDFQIPPQDNAPIDVNVFGPPALAIEISGSTFKDDLGAKRLLYERLGVAEYWVVNVAEYDVIAFAVADQRSGEVQTSEVLPGLEIGLVEEALRRSQTADDSTLMRWLMETLQ